MVTAAAIGGGNPPLFQDKCPVKIDDNEINEMAQIIAQDYIPFRLREKLLHGKLRGLPRHYLIPPHTVSELCSLVRKLCLGVEEQNDTFFKNVCLKLEINRKNASTIFVKVSEELFRTGINWGRILSMYSFAGVIAEHFVNAEEPDMVVQVVAWVGMFVDKNLKEWIRHQGGWESMLNHFSRERTMNIWPGLLAFGSACALAGIMFVFK